MFTVWTPHFRIKRTTSWTSYQYSNYIITLSQIILAFWLVLTYNLLDDRSIDEVISILFLFLYSIKQIDFTTKDSPRNETSYNAHWIDSELKCPLKTTLDRTVARLQNKTRQVSSADGASRLGGLGACPPFPPRKFWNLEAQKCSFKHFPWHYSSQKSILGKCRSSLFYCWAILEPSQWPSAF